MKQLRNFKTEERAGSKRIEDELELARRTFGDMGEDALLTELKARVDRAKRDGSYSQEQMLGYVSRLSPYLTDQQKSKLEALLKDLG